jgi:hypothetical protein
VIPFSRRAAAPESVPRSSRARATNTALVQVVDGEFVCVYPGRNPDDDSAEPNR